MAQGSETHGVPALAVTIQDKQEGTEDTEKGETGKQGAFLSLCYLCYLLLNLEWMDTAEDEGSASTLPPGRRISAIARCGRQDGAFPPHPRGEGATSSGF